MRCSECGILLRDIRLLDKGFCSNECEQKKYKRWLRIKNSKEFNINKKQVKKEQTKALKEEVKKKKMLQRLEAKSSWDPFFLRQDWRMLRYQALKTYGRICVLCGETSGKMHVDHIKPRSKYPELALTFENLQILCEACNLGKSNTDETDFRTKIE